MKQEFNKRNVALTAESIRQCPYIYHYEGHTVLFGEINGVVKEIEGSLGDAFAKFSDQGITLTPAKFDNPSTRSPYKDDAKASVVYYLNMERFEAVPHTDRVRLKHNPHLQYRPL